LPESDPQAASRTAAAITQVTSLICTGLSP
jgi:hypothetical protein